jgi:hypothetical protein
MELFDSYAQHADEGTHFARAMGYLSATTADDVVAGYDASRATTIVDVGGSQGLLLAALLRAAPTAHGILFDLPHELPAARELVRRVGLQDRVELVGGDCFEAVPRAGDLYLLKQILECWDNARCARLLANIARAAMPHGKLLVIERLLPETPGPSPLFLTDLTMLALSGGRERSRQEFATLLAGAGYHIERIMPTSGPFSVMEAARGSQPTPGRGPPAGLRRACTAFRQGADASPPTRGSLSLDHDRSSRAPLTGRPETR